METVNIQDIQGVVRRRKKIFLVTFFLIFIAAVVTAFVLPPIYVSKATILIEEQQIPEEFVRSTITSYVDERLQAITQMIMSRTKLVEVIEQFNLYPEMRNRYTVEEIVAKMREDIELETISADVKDRRTGRDSRATIAFTLSYQGKNPATTQKVANVLTSLYLEENLRSREQRALNTTEFLEREQNNIRARIERLEKDISEFKRANAGSLPENTAYNIQAATRIERDMDQLKTQLSTLQEKKIYLNGQLATVSPFQGFDPKSDPDAMKKMHLETKRLDLIALQTTLSEKHPDIIRLKEEIKELEAQVGSSGDREARRLYLASLEEELARKKGQLGPKHPDVVGLSKKIEALKENTGEGTDTVPGSSEATQRPVNPAYINLRTQIATTDMELDGVTNQIRELSKKMEGYQKRLEIAPEVENAYLNLVRNHENAKDMYNDISQKLMEARVAQGMEESQRGERFTIIDPAQLPEEPYKPNRLAVILIGFVLGLGAGVGAGAAGESLDTTIKTPDELRKVAGIPLLSVIPMIEEEQENRARLVKTGVALFAVVVAIVAGLIAINWFVMPLDILWIKIQKRLLLMKIA